MNNPVCSRCATRRLHGARPPCPELLRVQTLRRTRERADGRGGDIAKPNAASCPPHRSPLAPDAERFTHTVPWLRPIATSRPTAHSAKGCAIHADAPAAGHAAFLAVSSASQRSSPPSNERHARLALRRTLGRGGTAGEEARPRVQPDGAGGRADPQAKERGRLVTPVRSPVDL